MKYRFSQRSAMCTVAATTTLGVLAIAAPRLLVVGIAAMLWLASVRSSLRSHDRNLLFILCTGPAIVTALLIVVSFMQCASPNDVNEPPISGVVLDDALVEAAQVLAVGFVASMALALGYVILRKSNKEANHAPTPPDRQTGDK
jgi:hypothetical protein